MNTNDPTSSETWLTPLQVAAVANISRRTLFRLWDEGRGPRRVKLGHRTVRCRAGWVEDWLRSNEEAA